MMKAEEVMDAAAIKIAEAHRQRDKARRELSRARALLKEMMLAHTADIESYEDEDAPALKTWARIERFLEGRKSK
jgi:hypothetical protein